MSDVTLYLGDCLEYMRGMDDKSVDTVITDPPYGIDLGNANNGQSKERQKRQDSFFEDTPEFVESVCVPAVKMCIEKFGRVIVTPGNRNLWKYPPPADLGCWFIPASVSRSRWGFTYMSPILYYGKSPRAGHGETPNSVSMTIAKDKDIKHPCPKPLNFIRWLIAKGSKEGDTIFDPFMGSGTTGVAAVQLGRNFIGCEINPAYFEIAKRRIETAQQQMVMEFK